MRLTEDEIDQMRAEDFNRRQYRLNLEAHPDCRDPDHVGCELCEDDDEENDDDA
jgi:hypothetical protein